MLTIVRQLSGEITDNVSVSLLKLADLMKQGYEDKLVSVDGR